MNPNNQPRPPDPLTNLPQPDTLSTTTGNNSDSTSPSKPGEKDLTSQFKLAAEAFQHLKSFQSALSTLNYNHNYDSSINFSSSLENTCEENELREDKKKSILINFDLDNISAQIGGPLSRVSMDSLKKNLNLCEMLIDNPFLSDGKIIINGLSEYTYYVHKEVLTERSVYFNRMLGNEFKEGSEEDIHLELIHPESFHTVLHYLYTEKLPSRLECDSRWRTTKDEYYNLLWTGHYLQIDSLTQKLVSMFDFAFAHCDKFQNEYMPIELFLKRMTNHLTQMVAKGAKENAGKCVKCKYAISYLETVLLYANNSKDEEVCKSVIEWSVRYNLSKHVKIAKLSEKLTPLSPSLRRMIDPLGLLENNTCKDEPCYVTPSKHTKNSRHNGLVMIAGHCL